MGSATASPRGPGDRSHQRERGELRRVVGLGASDQEMGWGAQGKGRGTTSRPVTTHGFTIRGLGAKPQTGGLGAC